MTAMDDYSHAHQPDGLLLPGTGLDPLFYGAPPAVRCLSIDTYSATQRANDMAIYGAKVSEPMTDCTSLISAGGPLQIQNLVVTGDIPPTAKVHIKQRFAQGVIIK